MATGATTANVRATTRPRGLLQSRALRERIWASIVTLIIFCGAIFLLFPVFFMIATSLKTIGQAFLLPITWLPGVQFTPQWHNFADALAFMNWLVVYGNTLKVAVNNIVADVVTGSIVAYGFARFRARGKNVIFIIMIATLMIPYVTRLVPEYLLFAHLGMINTLFPLTIPAWFGSAFNIFLLRQFFMSIPREMDEAAKVDGAGPIRVFYHVLLPQIRPALAVVAIGSFTFNWNDFLRPLIYLNSQDMQTAAVALSGFQAVYGGTPFNLLMAASLVNLFPVLVVFFVAQRYFIQGIVISGVKG
jgi:ABC-type glycerol-3-phosphate transport system permease component